jgi:hypothetical protein
MYSYVYKYTLDIHILVMVLFLSILALTYEVPKLNTPKYITLQKITAKIEHFLNTLWGYIMKVLVQKRIVDTKLDIYLFISYIW